MLQTTKPSYLLTFRSDPSVDFPVWKSSITCSNALVLIRYRIVLILFFYDEEGPPLKASKTLLPSGISLDFWIFERKRWITLLQKHSLKQQLRFDSVGVYRQKAALRTNTVEGDVLHLAQNLLMFFLGSWISSVFSQVMILVEKKTFENLLILSLIPLLHPLPCYSFSMSFPSHVPAIPCYSLLGSNPNISVTVYAII